jgi:hypothetical protein
LKSNCTSGSESEARKAKGINVIELAPMSVTAFKHESVIGFGFPTKLSPLNCSFLGIETGCTFDKRFVELLLCLQLKRKNVVRKIKKKSFIYLKYKKIII